MGELEKTKEHVTICYECRHFMSMGIQGYGDGDCSNVWYNHICNPNPLPLELNVVTGKRETQSGNRAAYCRDINTGHCEDFEAK